MDYILENSSLLYMWMYVIIILTVDFESMVIILHFTHYCAPLTLEESNPIFSIINRYFA